VEGKKLGKGNKGNGFLFSGRIFKDILPSGTGLQAPMSTELQSLIEKRHEGVACIFHLDIDMEIRGEAQYCNPSCPPPFFAPTSLLVEGLCDYILR